MFRTPRPSLDFSLDVLFSTLDSGRGPAAIGAAGESENEEL